MCVVYYCTYGCVNCGCVLLHLYHTCTCTHTHAHTHMRTHTHSQGERKPAVLSLFSLTTAGGAVGWRCVCVCVCVCVLLYIKEVLQSYKFVCINSFKLWISSLPPPSKIKGERLPPRSSSRGHHSNPSNPTVKVSISGLGQNEPEGVASISSIPSTTSIMSVGSNHSHSDASQPTIVEVTCVCVCVCLW